MCVSLAIGNPWAPPPPLAPPVQPPQLLVHCLEAQGALLWASALCAALTPGVCHSGSVWLCGVLLWSLLFWSVELWSVLFWSVLFLSVRFWSVDGPRASKGEGKKGRMGVRWVHGC